MFAPDPMSNSITLEADVVDGRGLRASYAFQKVADFSWWRAIPRFRHSKYAANLSVPELQAEREIAARHAVRRLEIPDAAFPVDVSLIYQVTPTPPPGGPPADPMKPPQPVAFATFHFAKAEEVRR
jgi:hypothetical protein